MSRIDEKMNRKKTQLNIWHFFPPDWGGKLRRSRSMSSDFSLKSTKRWWFNLSYNKETTNNIFVAFLSQIGRFIIIIV